MKSATSPKGGENEATVWSQRDIEEGAKHTGIDNSEKQMQEGELTAKRSAAVKDGLRDQDEPQAPDAVTEYRRRGKSVWRTAMNKLSPRRPQWSRFTAERSAAENRDARRWR